MTESTGCSRLLGVTLCLLAVLAVGSLVGAGHASAENVTQAAETHVVATDGSGEYTTIQAAVNAASSGDRVEVRPGVYQESVIIDANITVVAPRGAVLEASPATRRQGIIIKDGEPTVSGFTIRGFYTNIEATETTGNWILRDSVLLDGNVSAIASTGAWTLDNVTVVDARWISTYNSSGSWTITESTIRQSHIGIFAFQSEGDWSVSETAIRNMSGDRGINADRSTGNWTVTDVVTTEINGVGVSASESNGSFRIVNVTARNNAIRGLNMDSSSGDWVVEEAVVTGTDGRGISASESTGDWTVRDSIIRGSQYSGLGADQSTGNWTVTNVSIRNNAKHGVSANGTGGTWTVHQSTLVGNDRNGISAIGAAPAGDATRNWWGDAGGPDETDCVGNVDCSVYLTSPSGGIARQAVDQQSGNGTVTTAETAGAGGVSVFERFGDNPALPVGLAGVVFLAIGAVAAARLRSTEDSSVETRE